MDHLDFGVYFGVLGSKRQRGFKVFGIQNHSKKEVKKGRIFDDSKRSNPMFGKGFFGHVQKHPKKGPKCIGILTGPKKAKKGQK